MDAAVAEALNQLLEEERACVEALVGLASMATDMLERQAVTIMGGQTVRACGDLHEQLASGGAPISGRIGGAGLRVLGPDRVDGRCLAFSQVQQELAASIDTLLAEDLDFVMRSLLVSLRDVHLAHAVWSARRAEEFAATREAETGSTVAARGVLSRGMPPPRERTDSPVGDRHEAREGGAAAGSPEGIVAPVVSDNQESQGPPTSRGRLRRTPWPDDEEPGETGNGHSDPAE